jgi:hypothetical protein
MNDVKGATAHGNGCLTSRNFPISCANKKRVAFRAKACLLCWMPSHSALRCHDFHPERSSLFFYGQLLFDLGMGRGCEEFTLLS